MAEHSGLTTPRQLLITLSPTLCAALVASITKTQATYDRIRSQEGREDQQQDAQQPGEQDALLDGA